MPSALPADAREQLQTSIAGQFLSTEQFEVIASLAKPIDVLTGEFLFREGETNHCVYFMLEGQIDLVMRVPGRGNQRILTLGPGELVAWSALLGDGIMTCSALCIRDAKLVAIDGTAIGDRVQKDHEFGYHFMRMVSKALAQRLTATRLQLLDLFSSKS